MSESKGRIARASRIALDGEDCYDVQQRLIITLDGTAKEKKNVIDFLLGLLISLRVCMYACLSGLGFLLFVLVSYYTWQINALLI